MSDSEVICEVNGVVVLARLPTGDIVAPEGLEGVAAYFESRGTPEDLRAGSSSERDEWRSAALQARDDLRDIEREFIKSTPPDEDGPNPPIGPGQRFADWTRPANTMRWIDRLEGSSEEPTHD